MTFIGVAWNGSRDAMQAFVERHGLTFPNIVDPSGEVFARYGVPSQPAWVFIDADGGSTRVQGSLDDQELIAYIDAIVT